MYEHQLLRLGQAMRLGAGFSQGVAKQDHARAMIARVLDLGIGREGGHDDGGGNGQPAGVIGHALGVVARRDGDHAAPPFIGRQPG